MRTGLQHFNLIIAAIQNTLVFESSEIKNGLVQFLEVLYNGLKSDIPYFCECADEIICLANLIVQKCLRSRSLTYGFFSKGSSWRRKDLMKEANVGAFLPLKILLYYVQFDREAISQKQKTHIQEGIFKCLNIEYLFKGELVLFDDSIFKDTRVTVYYSNLPKSLPLVEQSAPKYVTESPKKFQLQRECKTQFSCDESEQSSISNFSSPAKTLFTIKNIEDSPDQFLGPDDIDSDIGEVHEYTENLEKLDLNLPMQLVAAGKALQYE
jgi:hypothetical protein